MEAIFNRNLASVGTLTTFKVLVSVFFALLFSLVDYLSVLQESEDISVQNQRIQNEKTFDYIIGLFNFCLICLKIKQIL